MKEEAEAFIKSHKQELIKLFADPDIYQPTTNPVSLFMAGSPGAGKTEVSKRLIEKFTDKPVRIDADEIRKIFPNYDGTNSHSFQSAATIGVNKLYDFVIDNNLNMILDGTFAYSGALTNVQRSIDHKRKVEIYYLYQDPMIAWTFTKKREEIEHRHVSEEVFIKAFLQSRINVNEAKSKFKEKIELHLIIKNFSTGLEDLRLNIPNVDSYLDKVYTETEILDLLKNEENTE